MGNLGIEPENVWLEARSDIHFTNRPKLSYSFDFFVLPRAKVAFLSIFAPFQSFLGVLVAIFSHFQHDYNHHYDTCDAY